MLKIFVIGWIVLPLFLYAQPVSDSSAIAVMPADSSKVLRMLAHAYQLSSENVKEALDIADNAFDLAEDQHFAYGKMLACNYIGIFQTTLGLPNEALESQNEALKICKENNFIKNKSDILRGIGNIFNIQREDSSAIYYFNLSTTLADSLNDSLALSKGYNNLGVIYSKKEYLSKSLNYYKLAFKFSLTSKDIITKLNIIRNISVIYVEMEDYDSAIFYTNELMKISEKNNSKYGLMLANCGIAEIYFNQKMYDESIFAAQKAAAIAEASGSEFEIARIYKYIGDAYFMKKNIKETIRCYQRAEAIYREIEDYESTMEVLYGLAQATAELPDIEGALMMLSEAMNLARLHENYRFLAVLEKEKGMLYLKVDDGEAALTHLASCISLVNAYKLAKEEYKEVYKQLSELYVEYGKIDESKKLSTIYESLNKEDQ